MQPSHNAILTRLRKSWPAPVSMDLIWLLAPVVLAFALLAWTPLREGDLWWHLKLGELILRARGLPAAETFSFTLPAAPAFIGHYWLADVMLYALVRLSGLAGLVLFQACALALTIGLVEKTALYLGASRRMTGLAAMLAVIGIVPFATARPQVVSFVLFAALLLILAGWWFRERKGLWLLPLLMAGWVNMHPAWTMGFLMLVVVNGIAAISGFSQRMEWSKIRSLWIWSAAAAVALLFNPAGWQAALSPWVTANTPALQYFISEWQPVSPLIIETAPFYLSILLLMICLAASSHRPGLFEMGVVLPLTLLSFRYMRTLPFFYIGCTPVLAALFTGLKLKQPVGGREGSAGPGAPWINRLILVTLAAAVLVSLPYWRGALTNRGEALWVGQGFPGSASEYLASNSPQSGRIFSKPEWGGYLIWKHSPDMQVFVDGRAELFPWQIIQDYFLISDAEAGWLEKLRQYQVTILVLDNQQQARLIQAAESAGLDRVHTDQNATIFMLDPAQFQDPE